VERHPQIALYNKNLGKKRKRKMGLMGCSGKMGKNGKRWVVLRRWWCGGGVVECGGV
jgi:hypothetical protein